MAPVGIERVQVDPDALEGPPLDAGCDAFEAGRPFLHDAAWLSKACEQIRTQRFALLNLPQKFARLYGQLLEPNSYPPELQTAEAAKEAGTIAAEALPIQLGKLLSSWNSICERLCTLVADELLSLTSPARRQLLASGARPHHQAQGMLRISFNSSAGPHFDNAFVTFMGVGNLQGALQFSVLGPGAPPALDSAEGSASDWPDFAPCEAFFDEPKSGTTDFLLFAGCKVASPAAEEYKPLLHRVEYRSQGEGHARINAIYFLRDYARGEHASSRSHLEVHAFNRTAVSDAAFVCQVPELPACEGKSTRPSEGAGTTDDEAQWQEDASSSDEGFDWSTEGVPEGRCCVPAEGTND